MVLDGDLLAVGLGDGSWALVTTVKVFRMAVGLYNNIYESKNALYSRFIYQVPILVFSSSLCTKPLKKTNSLITTLEEYCLTDHALIIQTNLHISC